MKRKYYLLCCLLFCFTLVLSSCSANIEDTAANSISAIFSVIGEYLFALLCLVLFVLIRIIRPISIALILVGAFGLLGLYESPISPLLLFIIGLVLISSFFVPENKIYVPKVNIARNMIKKIVDDDVSYDIQPSQNKTHFVSEIIVGLVVGFVLMIVEHLCFK